MLVPVPPRAEFKVDVGRTDVYLSAVLCGTRFADASLRGGVGRGLDLSRGVVSPFAKAGDEAIEGTAATTRHRTALCVKNASQTAT